jgi:hypothetical protein
MRASGSASSPPRGMHRGRGRTVKEFSGTRPIRPKYPPKNLSSSWRNRMPCRPCFAQCPSLPDIGGRFLLRARAPNCVLLRPGGVLTWH